MTINSFMANFKNWMWENDIDHAVKQLMQACFSFQFNENLKKEVPDPASARAALKKVLDEKINQVQAQKNTALSQMEKIALVPKIVLNAIRHNFTNYDHEYQSLLRGIDVKNSKIWRKFAVKGQANPEHKKPVQFQNPVTGKIDYFDFENPQDQENLWKAIVVGVYDLVDSIIAQLGIEQVINSKLVHLLQVENRQWRDQHLNRFFRKSTAIA